MKFFITGANGFIGSYLSAFLLSQGHEVVACSRRFFPGVKEKLEGATFTEADVTSAGFETLSIEADAVIHLASANDVISRNPVEGMTLSAGGTLNALKLAVNNKVDKFIFFSTLQVYGTELSGAYDESTAVKPGNDYALNHLFAEQYVEMFSRKHTLKTLVMRPSNIYGHFISPEIDRWTLVPGCFIREALEKGTITLLSSGRQLRNFISLEQLSRNTLRAAQQMDQPFEIKNLVSGDYYSIAEVAHLTAEIFNKRFNRSVTVITGPEESSARNHFTISEGKMPEQPEGFSLADEIEKTIASLLNKQNSP